MQNLLTKIKHRALFIVFTLLFTNLLTMKFFWYDAMWWFDMPMHFAGGVFIGLFFFYVFYTKTKVDFGNINKFTNMVLICTLLTTIAWEAFEFFVAYVTKTPMLHGLDSLSDVCFGMAGVSLALIYVYSNIEILKSKTVHMQNE